jgi:hypothetical protein
LPDLPKVASSSRRSSGRPADSGRDTIDARGHEDVANAVAGLLCIAAAPRTVAGTIPLVG